MARYQPFLDLPAGQFEQLKADIEVRGVILPILVDEHGQVIDGHQRRMACAQLGIECPKVVVDGLTEEEKIGMAFTLNLFRRHLGGTERAKAISELARRGLSTRRISELVGLSKSAVHRDLTEMEEAGELERPDTVTSKDGREVPSRWSPDRTVPPRDSAPPPNVDENGEILPSEDTATSGSDQSTPDLTAGTDPSDEGGDAAGSGDDEPEQESAGSEPDPEGRTPTVPPLDPTLKYRKTATHFRAQTREGLLTLDPERVIQTSDDPKAWADIAADLHSFADRIDQALAGPRLKAVP